MINPSVIRDMLKASPGLSDGVLARLLWNKLNRRTYPAHKKAATIRELTETFAVQRARLYPSKSARKVTKRA